MGFQIDYFYRWNERIFANSAALDADGAISNIITSNLAPNKLLVSDASGKIIISSLVTATEADYLSGATSNIQDQLDAKQASLTLGNLTEATSSVLTVTGGTGAIIGSGLTIQVKLAGAAQSGYLSATDWNTFNNKLSTTLTSARIFVGNGSNVATGVAVSGDITIDNAGIVAIAAGVIVNADINASAGITRSKTASGTAYRILANNATGVMSENVAITASRAVVSDTNGQLINSATTAAQIGYLSTLTSDVQVQIDTEIASQSVNAIVTIPTITQNGFAITWDNTAGEYTLTDPVVQGIPIGGTTNYALTKVSGADYDAAWTNLTLSYISDVTALSADVNVLVGADAALVTPTIISYLGTANPLSSPIQDQLDAKQSSSLAQNALWVGNGSGIAAQLSGGTTGYILTSVAGSPQWQPSTSGITGLTTNRVPYATSATTLGDDSALLWDSTNNILTVGNGTIGRLNINTGATNNAINIYNNSVLQFYIVNAAANATEIANVNSGVLSFIVGGSSRFTFNTSGALGVNGTSYGTAGQVLTSGGSAAVPTWSTSGLIVGTSTLTSGTNTRVPFNDSGIYAEDDAFSWDKTSNTLSVGYLALGNSGLAGSNRIISTVGSASDINLVQSSKGTGQVMLSSGTTLLALGNSFGTLDITGGIFYVTASSSVLATEGGVSTAYPIKASNYTASFGVGVGTGIQIETRTASAHDEIGATIVSVPTDVTGGSEDFDLYFATMQAGLAASEKLRITSVGNVGIGTATFGTGAVTVLAIANGTEPSTAPANTIQIFAKDSSDGSANSTLALYCEQAPEATGTFTQTHRLKVWINGTEFWLSLDQV